MTDNLITRQQIIGILGYDNIGKLRHQIRRKGIKWPKCVKIEQYSRKRFYDRAATMDWLKQNGFIHDFIDSNTVAELLNVQYKLFIENGPNLIGFPKPVIKWSGRSKQLFNRDEIVEWGKHNDTTAQLKEARMRRYRKYIEQKPEAVQPASGSFNELAQAFIRSAFNSGQYAVNI
jgi:hypothetical protein